MSSAIPSALRTLRFGHSPDADDAFMFYGLASGRVAVPGYRVDHVLDDIETLNRRASAAELDVTAISYVISERASPTTRTDRTASIRTSERCGGTAIVPVWVKEPCARLAPMLRWALVKKRENEKPSSPGFRSGAVNW